jgi:hypothetical protein
MHKKAGSSLLLIFSQEDSKDIYFVFMTFVQFSIYFRNLYTFVDPKAARLRLFQWPGAGP